MPAIGPAPEISKQRETISSPMKVNELNRTTSLKYFDWWAKHGLLKDKTSFVSIPPNGLKRICSMYDKPCTMHFYGG